jgi:hypothetical protein
VEVDLTVGASPEEWVGRPVSVRLAVEPEPAGAISNPRAAFTSLRGWLEGVSEYGLMLRQERPEGARIENIAFYPWTQVRFVRLADPDEMPA